MHHGTNDNRVFTANRAYHRPFDHLPHAQDRNLGLVDDGKTVEVAFAPGVRNGEGASPQIIGRKLLASRSKRKFVDRGRHSRQRQTVGVAHHRDHQTFFGLDRDPDVDRALFDD